MVKNIANIFSKKLSMCALYVKLQFFTIANTHSSSLGFKKKDILFHNMNYFIFSIYYIKFKKL